MISSVTYKSITGIEFNQLEYVRTVGPQPYDSHTFRIRFPKTMVYIDQSGEVTEHFDRGIFINAPSCKVTTGNTVTSINYVTVPKSTNCDLRPVSVDGVVPDNTLLLCACMNGNPNDMIIIDSV